MYSHSYVLDLHTFVVIVIRSCRYSGHVVGSFRVSGSAVHDGHRDPRPLRRAERHVVAAVRKRRSNEVRANLDHFVPELDVRGRHIRPEAGGRHGVREHFGERETRFV